MAAAVATKTKEESEKEIAECISKLNNFLDKDCKTLTEEVNGVKSKLEGLEKIQTENVVKELEKLRAGQEAVIKMIRTNSRAPSFVPGMEDASQKFSMVKVLTASKVGWKEAKAEFEKECMDAWQAKLKTAGAIGDDKMGGFWVPDQVIPDVIAAIYARSVFFSLGADGTTRVSVLDGLVGGTVKIPKVTGGMVAYWVGEEQAPAESMDNAGDITMNPKKLMMLVKLTDSMRRFGGFGFENILRNDMINTAAEKFDWTVAYGNGGADMPRGIINTSGIKIFSAEKGGYGVLGTDSLADTGVFQATWAGAALTFDVVDLMNLALEEDKIRQGPSAIMITSPRALSYLRRLKVTYFSGQTSGQGYLLGLPILSDARLADIIGAFDKTPQIPSNNYAGKSVGATPTNAATVNCTDVFKGNLAEVIVGRWSGLEIETDGGMGPGFKSDHIYTKMRMYADVGVRQPRGIIVCPDAIVR
jgi:HK97 family phage major capsid protein